MKVLVGCELSGHVREAFRRRGHDAWSCDLEEADDVSEFHIKGDVMEVLTEDWDLMIAHPVCTYLTSSGLHWNKRIPGREAKTTKALVHVRGLMMAPIERIAIENPPGRIGTAIRPADQYIQPNEFGHDASKTTGLWLKNLPLLEKDPDNYIEPRWVCCEEVIDLELGCPTCHGGRRPLPRWANQTNSGQNKLGPSDDRAKLRAETYPGIADAFADQWGRVDVTIQADLFS